MKLVCVYFLMSSMNVYPQNSISSHSTINNYMRIYSADTIKKVPPVDSLKNNGIELKEVIIRGTTTSSKKKLAEIQKEYKDPNIAGGRSILGLLGSPVQTLYNIFSKRAKRARKLNNTIELDYNEAEIDSRYTPIFVTSIIGLTGQELIDFMRKYRPSYKFVSAANDYDMIQFVRKSYQEYQGSLQEEASLQSE